MTNDITQTVPPLKKKRKKMDCFPLLKKKEKNGYRLLLIVLYAFPKGMSKFPNLSDFQLLK